MDKKIIEGHAVEHWEDEDNIFVTIGGDAPLCFTKKGWEEIYKLLEQDK